MPLALTGVFNDPSTVHCHRREGQIAAQPSHDGRFDVDGVRRPSIRPRGLAPPLPSTVTWTSFRRAVAIKNIDDEPMGHDGLQISPGRAINAKNMAPAYKNETEKCRSRGRTLPTAPSHPCCRDHPPYDRAERRVEQGGGQKGGGRLPLPPSSWHKTMQKLKNKNHTTINQWDCQKPAKHTQQFADGR